MTGEKLSEHPEPQGKINIMSLMVINYVVLQFLCRKYNFSYALMPAIVYLNIRQKEALS